MTKRQLRNHVNLEMWGIRLRNRLARTRRERWQVKSNDEKYHEAIGLFVIEKRVSISLLQRRKGFGYAEARRMLERMQQDEIIVPSGGIGQFALNIFRVPAPASLAPQAETEKAR